MPDPVKKYRTPNNQIVSKKELQAKYTDQLDGLISKGTFTEINEAIYKTPNGGLETESVLKEKYGNRFQELVDTNMFALDTAPKKKASSETSSQNSSDGSLDDRGQLVKDLDAGVFDDQLKSFNEEQTELEKQDAEKMNSLISNYKSSIALNDEDFEDINNTIDEELNDDFGFLNSVGNLLKRAITAKAPKSKIEGLLEQTKADIAKERNIEIKDVTSEEAKKIYIENRKNELTGQALDAKKEEFVEDLTKEDKDTFEKHYSINAGKLSSEVTNNLLNIKSIGQSIEEIDNELKAIDDNHDDERTDYPIEYYQKNNQLVNQREELSERLNTIITDFGNNEKDLLSAQEELDIFKRNYGTWENFSGKLGISSQDLALNLEVLLNKGGRVIDKLYDSVGIPSALPEGVSVYDEKDREVILQKAALDKKRGLLRKAKTVDGIKTFEDATEWALDLVAEQTPNTILMATTGGASLPIMGASASGGKLFELEKEERETGQNFTALQKYGTTFITGFAEAASEKISLGQINKAKRVFNSIGKDQLKENTLDYLKRTLPDYVKDLIQEGGSESIAQLSENLADKYLLGKDINLTDGLKDSFVSGAFMSGVVYKAPGIANVLTQPFTLKDTNQKLGENFDKITALNQELEKDISPENKAVIEKKRNSLLETNEKLLQDSFDNVDTLTPKAKNELLDIESKKFEVRKNAKALQEDANINGDVRNELLKDLKTEIQQLDAKKEEILSEDISVAQPAQEANTESEVETSTLENETQENEDVKGVISDLFETAKKIKHKVVKKVLRKVTPEEVTQIKEATGIELDEDFKHTIDNSAITHIVRKHGNRVKEEKRGQLPVTKNDLELIPEILDNYDAIEKGEINNRGLETILYTKTFEDGNTYIVEEVREGKKELALSTMYKRKSSGLVQNIDDVQNPPHTSETTLDEAKVQKESKTAQTTVEDIAKSKSKDDFLQGAHRLPLEGLDPNFDESTKAKITSTKSKNPNAPIVVGFEDGQIQILDGAHRYYEAKERGDTDIEVRFTNNQGAEQFYDKLNETQTQRDTDADGNVQPRVDTSVQQREDNKAQPTIKPTASKAAPKVKRIKSPGVKNAEFDVTFDSDNNVTKIVSTKDGREVSKFRYSRKTGKPLGKNANYYKIVSDATGVPTDNQINKEEKQKRSESLEKYNPTTEYEHALDAVARGLNISLESAKQETGLSDAEVKWITGFKQEDTLPSVEKAAEKIAQDSNQELDESKLRDALIDIISRMEGVNNVQDAIVDTVNTIEQENEDVELRAILASLSEKELSLYESITKEDDFISELTYEEAIEYYEEQYGKEKDRNTAEREAFNEVTKSESKSPRQRKEKDTGEQGTQGRVDALSTERIKPLKTKPTTTPKPLNKIIANVSKALRATLVYGKPFNRKFAGTYTPSNALVKIRNANDLDTVAHELGHLLDDRHSLLDGIEADANKKTLNKQLKWFSDRGGSNPPSSLSSKAKKTYLQREGLAELIRSYVVNPKATKATAKELYNFFESAIDPKTKTVLKEFSQDILNFENATYGDKINANVEDSRLKERTRFKGWLEQFKSEDGVLNIHYLDKIKSGWTNSLHVANKAFKYGLQLQGKDLKELNPSNNFEVISRLLAGVNGKINYLFGNGLVNAKNKTIKDSKGLKINLDYLLEVLDNTSEKILRNEMRDVIKLLVAERTIEYATKFERSNKLTGIGGGLSSDLEIAVGHLEEVKQLKKDDPEKHKRIKEAARRYREFADAGLRYAVDKGRISQENYDRIKETNEYYVSLARTKEVTPGDELLPFLNDSNKITSVKEVIKKAKGGTDTIKDPYMSLLHNTVNFIKESDRNEVINSFIEPFRSKRKKGDEVIDLSQVARKVPSGEPNSKKIYNNGEVEYWQFDQDIYDSLTSLEGVAHNAIINALALPSDLIRFTVTNFPVFAARNATRDTLARLVISRTKGKITDLLYKKEDREAFELYGGSQAGFYLQNKDAYVDEMNKAVKKLTKKKGIILDPRKLSYNGYRRALEKGENLNRIAEYKSAYRKAKKEGLNDYEAGLYAAYQARDLLDFAVAGHYMRVINRIIPFSNAAIQSIKRNVKGAKENPGKFAMRMALYTVIPQLVFRAMVVATGDEEEYEELPDYQRDLFWNFKTPLTGDLWITIPKPFELGLPSSFIDRGISAAQGKEDAFDGFDYSSYNTLNPFDVFSLAGSGKPLVEAVSNYDSFRDRDIVPFWEKDKLIELRDGTKYASRIGKGLSDTFGLLGGEVDPRKIDHVIKGYTTYFGNTVLSLGDVGKEDSRNQFNFTKTGFAKGVPISNAKSVKKALDLAKSIGSESDSKVKVLKGMVKLYYDLDNKADRKTLSKEIYKYSRGVLIPYLEAKKTLKLIEADIEN